MSWRRVIGRRVGRVVNYLMASLIEDSNTACTDSARARLPSGLLSKYKSEYLAIYMSERNKSKRI